MVRAPGLEPGLVRGKGPVPYPSGVTRAVGREGIEPPVSIDGCSTGSGAPWRDRPMVVGARCGAGSDELSLPMRLSRCWWPNWMPGALAGPEGVEPSAVGFGDRGATLARALANGDMRLAAHDGVRGIRSGAWKRKPEGVGYQLMPGAPYSASPAHAGLA